MAQCLVSLIETGAGVNPVQGSRIFSCVVNSFDYKVSNIDGPDHFAFRTGMVAFKIAKTLLAFIVLGIVWHYERFGGDPRKRTIFNQLIGMIALNIMTVELIAAMSLIFRLLFWALVDGSGNVDICCSKCNKQPLCAFHT